jgi:hypothetical protein
LKRFPNSGFLSWWGQHVRIYLRASPCRSSSNTAQAQLLWFASHLYLSFEIRIMKILPNAWLTGASPRSIV